MPGEAAAIVASAAAPVAPPVVETPAAPVLGADGKPAPIAAPAKDATAFAALAQAEKVKREGVLQLKSERTKLDQERQAIAAEKAVLEKSKRELAEYADWKAKAKASPLDVMKALGIDYDAATAQRLNGGKPTAEQIVAPLAEKLTTLEQKLAQEREEGTKAAQAKRQAEIAEVEKRFEASCASFVEGSDKHPLTKVYEGSHLVGEVIREHWKQQEASAEVEGTTPKMLSIQEAADLVEKHFEEKFTRAQEAKKPKTETPAAGNTPKKPEVKSLSTDLGTSTVGTEATKKRLTPKEKHAAVLKKYAGQ